MLPRTVVVAAIQPDCSSSSVEANLNALAAQVAQAAEQGADIVLLPERFSEAFRLDHSAWSSASARGGRVEEWLQSLASRHGIYLGGSYLEARGQDFYNTFALAAPTGVIAGRVGKDHPCSLEAYVFSGRPGPQVIETDIGRIGIAICYDNSLRCVIDRLLAGDPDILLMPMSAPTPPKSLFYSERRIASYHASFRNGAIQAAQSWGIPAVMANKAGVWETPLPGLLPAVHSRYPGFSHIADNDGTELARLGDKVGLIVATVHMDPSKKHFTLPAEVDRYRPWIAPVPLDWRSFAIFEWFGRRAYRRSRERAALASRTVANDHAGRNNP